MENDKLSILNIKVSNDGIVVKADGSYTRNRGFDPGPVYWMDVSSED